MSEMRTSPLTRHLRDIAAEINDEHKAGSIVQAADLLDQTRSHAQDERARPVAWRVHYCGQWLYFENEAACESYCHSNNKAEPLYQSQAKEPEASGGLCADAPHAVRVGEPARTGRLSWPALGRTSNVSELGVTAGETAPNSGSHTPAATERPYHTTGNTIEQDLLTYAGAGSGPSHQLCHVAAEQIATLSQRLSQASSQIEALQGAIPERLKSDLAARAAELLSVKGGWGKGPALRALAEKIGGEYAEVAAQNRTFREALEAAVDATPEAGAAEIARLKHDIGRLTETNSQLLAQVEDARRKAQEKADFWHEQITKDELRGGTRAGHYAVVASQFQSISAALTSTEHSRDA